MRKGAVGEVEGHVGYWLSRGGVVIGEGGGGRCGGGRCGWGLFSMWEADQESEENNRRKRRENKKIVGIMEGDEEAVRVLACLKNITLRKKNRYGRYLSRPFIFLCQG